MKYLTYLNSGCKSICDNMLYSANEVGINQNQFIIVAFDKPIFEYYSDKGYHVELFEDVPAEQYHNWTWDENSKFRALVKNKWQLIKKYFETYKPLVWLDTDIVFLKNPEQYFASLDGLSSSLSKSNVSPSNVIIFCVSEGSNSQFHV